MANVKITDLPASTDPASTDVLPIVEVSADATKKVSIETLLKNASDGTESAPSFSFDGDGNTGIYHPAADQVAISTGGSQRILIEDSGVTIPGNFTVNGTTTTIDTTTLVVEDKNIEIGKFATPTDTTADGGGITLKGASDKTISWVESTGCWTFNQPMDFNNHVRIDSSGNVFIGGTTASNADIALNANGNITTVGDIATTKSFGKLQSGTAVLIGSGTNGADFFLNANANYASGWKYTIDGVAAGIYGNTDGLVFRQAAAGTAGDAVSWTEQARLTTDGNFLIGGSLPNTPKIALKSDGSITAVGNLGVGTTAPSANMHVSKSYSAPTNGHDGNLIAIFSNSSSANSYAGIGIGAGNNAGSFIHFGDTDDDNVGRLNYLHDSDAFTFVTAASERMRIDSGNVGIGTSSPAFPLDITGPGTANASTLRINDAASSADSRHIHLTRASNNAYIGIAGSASNDPLFISRTGANSDFTINSSGNVGIGTSSPTVELDVTGDARLRSSSTSEGPILQFDGAGPNGTNYTFGKIEADNTGSNNAGELRFYTNLASAGGLAQRMVIARDGNVGIGTTSPGVSGLHVRNSSEVFLRLDHSATNTWDISNDSNLKFSRGGTERLRIDSLGFVGIGESSPGSYDSGARNLVVGSTSHTGILIKAGTSHYSNLYFGDGTGNDSFRGSVAYNHSEDSLRLSTAGSERLRVDSSGRLLLGTSSTIGAPRLDAVGNSASNTGEGIVQIRRGESVTTNNVTIGALNFGDTTSGGFRRAQIVASSDGAGGSGDLPTRLTFTTTADAASTPTERMRITSSGRMYLQGSPNLFISNTASAGTSQVMIAAGHSATDFETSTLSFRVYNNGNVQNTNNSYGAISDAKLKENIVDASSQWGDVKGIRVRNYNFIEGQTHTQIGVVAQEVETVSPGLVYESPDTDNEDNDLGTVTKSVNYSVLYMKAVKALQEAMERIETLEAKVAALEAG
jgi:hypothetical protein